MQIRELRLNIQFEYIKEIRKYIYDIEEFLKQQNLCDSLNQVPPIPDEIEPQIERLNSLKQEENKTINILVSQAGISILFTYIVSTQFDEKFKKELEYISSISKNIKNFLLKKHPAFKINYEGLILASSKYILKDDDIAKKRHNINILTEEDRRRVVKEIDEKHIQMIEKSLVKFYNDEKQNINPMAIKKDKNTFVGWNYILVLEINNRLQYDNSKDGNISLLLDLNFAYSKIEESFKKEAN